MTAAGGVTKKGSDRLISLDVFRGATIAAMMLVNNPGTWSAIYPPLRHAEWHGWTFTDMVFPFFLWIVGVAMTLSLARRAGRGDSRPRLVLHAARRAAILFGFGLFMAGFPYYDLSTLRIPGVLQRIAVCYFIATVIFLYTRVRGQILWTGGLLAGYWLLMKFAPVPGFGAGILEKEGNFAAYVDSLFLSGHMYSATRTWDPEGIISTIPAIATALFGILTGHLLRINRRPEEKAAWMFFGGNTLIAAGLMMNAWLPINKNLWTSSFSVFMAGMALSVFAASYWIIDVKGYRSWSKPLSIYGMNAIAVYVLAGLIARILDLIHVAGGDGAPMTLKEFIFNSYFAPLASPINASLIFGLLFSFMLYLISWVMYRNKWFLKI
jgi:predicted acyltransferase